MRSPLTWTSMCSRFFTVFASWTTWNQMAGPPLSGSRIRSAPPVSSSYGMPRSR
ncbi:hypothetical protein [Amycolatopsis thermoflava]|uniref:hypothetical protein n=1 Tax=Amycolatopsis thermoflava TaxID=84480 RepID=UPI003EBF40CD